jgi:predicted nucleic acid-binding protein
MIVDTSLLVALDRDDRAAVQRVRQYESAGVPLRVPTAVLMELYVSVGLGTKPNENAASLEALVANHPIVDLNENVARRAGTLLGLHRASDAKPALGAFDAIVAATGLVFNEAVLSGDTQDFGAVDGLNVESW